MFGLSSGMLWVVYAIMIIAYLLRKLNRTLKRYEPFPVIKEEETPFTLTIEDMYSPNNEIKYLTKVDKLFFLFVENKKINGTKFVSANNLKELKVQTIDVLKKMADIENGKADRSILF